MSWEQAVIGEPSYFDVTYALRNGTWTGRCDALAVDVHEDTLELARAAMRTAAKNALGTPDAQPVAVDRKESSYTEQLLVRRFLNQVTVGEVAGREPARGPYVTDDGQLLLRDSVVTVLDELGTSQRWLSALDQQDLDARAALIESTRSALTTPVSANVESAVSYTDNVVHAIPLGSSTAAETLLYAIPAPARYQLDMTCAGVLVRGGTDLGSHHASPNLLIGQALIRAHHVEANIAAHPRIVLAENAAAVAEAALAGDLADGDVEYLSGMLLRSSSDRHLFINYLALPSVFEHPEDAVTATLERHRDAVTGGLAATRGNPKFAAKWVWAADYHNHVASQLQLDASLFVIDTHGVGLGVHSFEQP